MGMSASSWDGWATLHVKPCFAIGYFFSSMILASILLAYLCTSVTVEGYMYYVVVVPLAWNDAVLLAVAFRFWRWGPAVAHHKLYPAVPALLMLCGMPMAYVAFLARGNVALA